MSVTKLVPACFDLNEGSRNIIIHHFCSVYICVVWEWRWQAGGGGGLCVCACACRSVRCSARCHELCCKVRQRPSVGRRPLLPSVLLGGQAICLHLSHCTIQRRCFWEFFWKHNSQLVGFQETTMFCFFPPLSLLQGD